MLWRNFETEGEGAMEYEEDEEYYEDPLTRIQQ